MLEKKFPQSLTFKNFIHIQKSRHDSTKFTYYTQFLPEKHPKAMRIFTRKGTELLFLPFLLLHWPVDLRTCGYHQPCVHCPGIYMPVSHIYNYLWANSFDFCS